MKIDRLLQRIGVDESSKPSTETKAERNKGVENEEKSTQSRDGVKFSQNLELKEDPEETAQRAEKVKRLADEVNTGSYSIDSFLLAKKLIEIA